ncbi:MAG: hypothetical protein HS114_34870 [Anaerolineales bacterium]|nr:hypothetical protein [Anaerolineales bacterium]
MPKLKDWQAWEEDDPRSRRQKRNRDFEEWGDEAPAPRKKDKPRRSGRDTQHRAELPPDAPRESASPPVEDTRRSVTPPTPKLAPAQPVVAHELTPLQLVRAMERNNTPQQIFKLIRQGTPIPRLAGALGLPLETVQRIYRQQQVLHGDFSPAAQSVRLREGGLSFPQIGEKLGVSESQARQLYAQGHVRFYGSDPTVQYGIRQKVGRQPFPADVFEQQPTFRSDTNRAAPVLSNIIGQLQGQLEPQGYRLETHFEADPLGGRYVVWVKQGDQAIGQPFRLSATPSGVPLLSKTGKGPGGYRLTRQGQAVQVSGSFETRLNRAVQQMIENARTDPTGPAYFDDDMPPDEGSYAPDLPYDDDSVPEMPDWMREGPPPEGLTIEPRPGPAAPRRPGKVSHKPLLNVLDILDVNAKRDPARRNDWKSIGADFIRLTHGGRFREENAEALIKNRSGEWDYPEAITNYSYSPAGFDPEGRNGWLTPMVSKGAVYPVEARNFIPGNIRLDNDGQWGSQKGLGKQTKRDDLSLTRKYLMAGPALGVSYPLSAQHILGQRATEPDVAHIARAFILDRGGIIPEGQMWKDVNYAPWAFGSFEENPEKYELRFNDLYSEEEVLRAAGLWDEAAGAFKPRLLKPGQKVASPVGFKKDLVGKNEAAVINGYEIVDILTEQGNPAKALRFKGFYGNRTNVVAAMKLEGWKNLAQDKHVREKMGLDADLVLNKPSDPVVANLSILNSLPREQFEDLWREVHGETPAPGRTATMEDLESLAPVWQRLQEKNRATHVFPGQIFDKNTKEQYEAAKIIRGEVKELPPLFEGAEPMFQADLEASGFFADVRFRLIDNVTNTREGHLANNILRAQNVNTPGLGDYLRELGYEGRDLYNTLYEMYRLNTQPGFDKVGSLVVDLIGDMTGNPEAQARLQAIQQDRLTAILPEVMRGRARAQYTGKEAKAYERFQNEAGAQAIQQYYQEALGTDSFILRIGAGQQAAYMVNPALTERFGYLDDLTNEKVSELKEAGEFQLKEAWRIVQKDQPGLLKWFLKQNRAAMQPLIAAQAELLQSAGARKDWFGTSHDSIFTHVHASDYSLPRNALAMGWQDILRTTGMKDTPENRKLLSQRSAAGQLLYGGFRNPASSVIAQTGLTLNMVTPDLVKEYGLDLPMAGHPILFHPHMVQAQGGDNDSDMSQIYAVLKRMAGGGLYNAFNLQPSAPEEITSQAKAHAAREYWDAQDKLNVTAEKAARNRLGFDPANPVKLDGNIWSPAQWENETLASYKLNSVQIGQAYNIPVRVGTELADSREAKNKISEYGGWLYQPPLDKEVYEPGSPEYDLFQFLGSFNALTGTFKAPSVQVAGTDGKVHDGTFAWRKNFGTRGQFGAAGMLAVIKALTEERPEGAIGTAMTKEQFAAFVTSAAGLPDKAVKMLNNWNLPQLPELEAKQLSHLNLSDKQKDLLERFAESDTPLAQMMRGYGVRNALTKAESLQKKLQFTLPVALELARDTGLENTGESSHFKRDLQGMMNIFQNEMFNFRRGSGSDTFKRDYEQLLADFGLEWGGPNKNNFFDLLDPGSKSKAAGAFWEWDSERRQRFYQGAGNLIEKHVTGVGFDQASRRWVLKDAQAARTNPLLAPWFKDYDRVRSMMTINARDLADEETEFGLVNSVWKNWSPGLDELEHNELTAPLVNEKYQRKQKALGGLSRLFERFKKASRLNGQSEIGPDFENFVSGKKPYTAQEEEMWRQAELGHEEARRLKRQRWEREGYNEPMYFAEGGVLDRATRIGQTKNGRDIIAGEAGREYVVPEGKTRDLGGGLKVFDEDALGKGTPAGPSSSPSTSSGHGSGQAEVRLAKGGVLDYESYANAPQNDFETAIRQVAYELSGGRFTGDVEAAKNLVRQQIETDIQRLAANPPQNGLPGLMASSMSGRATEMMALALGPNPAAQDFSTWNNLLAEYGLSADMQPLGVNPQQINPAIKKQLQQQAGGDPQTYKAALAGYMKELNTGLAAKSFSHANYGNVYNAIPGWEGYWNGNRPASTIPAIALSDVAQGNLARLIGGAGGGGGNGGLPPQDVGEQGSRGAGGIGRKEITAYAQPFNPQMVQMYKTLAEKLNQYASTIEELNQNGATLADVSGETAQVIKAAGKTYHRLEGQYSRAQRVLRYDQLQAKFDNFQYREGDPLTEDESRELSQLQEQMTKPTGADVAAAGKVKGYIQDIFPIYAERELAGRRGTRLPRQMIADSPLAWAAQIAGRDPGLVKESRQAERQMLRMGQLDRRLGDVQDWYAAARTGEAEKFSDRQGQQMKVYADEVSRLSYERQNLYEQAVPLKWQYEESLARGDYKTAQRLFDDLDPLVTEIEGLKDQIGTLTPHVKEHVEALRLQTGSIREEIKERKSLYSALTAQHDELQKQKVGLSGPDRLAKAGEIGAVRSEMDRVSADIKERAKLLGRLELEKRELTDLIHEPQGRSITGLGKRPQTYGQQAWNELVQGYAPQRLFWEFQNIQQMQYMAFMPMLQMRQQYLGEQAALGQANYALGAGTMPQSVLSAMASQANMSRASSAFGQGVDNSITMGLWKGLTGYLGQNEGAGSFLGAAGFDLTSGLTALMGAKMVGGPAVNAIGKLLPALGVKAAPYFMPAGGPGLGATTLAALGTGGGVVAGGLGLGLGLGINEYLASQNAGGNFMGLDWAAQPLSKHLTVAAYESAGYTGDQWGGVFNPANSWLLRAAADKTGLAGYMGWDVWNQDKAEAMGTAVGKYTGAVTEPIPVWVTKMENEVAKQLGVSTDQLPFDRAELAQMVQMAAEDQGLTKAQIEGGAGVAEKLAQEIADSYTSGVSMSQRSAFRQKAIDVSGYAPGTEGARMMSEWVNQGSLFERQQRYQAAALAQNYADAMNFTPQQRQDISQKVYDLLADGMSLDKASKVISGAMSQRKMENQYTWSAAAYASGHPEMALMDQAQPWMPKNQTVLWAIEDRRRAEDNARELGTVTLGANGFEWSGGRQEVELGWQRQKLDLEKEFWDFRRQSSLDDFAMQQKFFEFNIRQQRQAIEWEERQSRVQSEYYEKQYALNKKIFELQREWRIKDFNKQEYRMDVQRSWQIEDSAWNRESYNIQAGWQMEDLQRALRYASNGRERMDIRRQIERASIMDERKQTEFDREDSRNTTQYNWAKEDLAENRRRFEEMNELQRQQMELGREYWQQQQAMAESYREVRRASLEEQIALQQEQNTLTIQQWGDGMALQDKQHALETQINETKYQWALDDLALARQRSAEDEKILGLQRETTSASYFYSFYQAMGYDAAKKAKPELSDMATSAGKLADDMERAAEALARMSSNGGDFSIYGSQMNNPPAPTPYVGAPIIKPFAQGGYTGDGDPSEVAGIVHRGEYVVPQGGALVIREGANNEGAGSAEVVTLLAAILAQLQEGGGTILIDIERLKKAGFLHASNFQSVYR